MDSYKFRQACIDTVKKLLDEKMSGVEPAQSSFSVAFVIPNRLAFIDLETTGANPVRDRITEIGIVMVEGDQVSTWSTLVNPERPIPAFIQQLTGINNEMVADAPTFAQVTKELAGRLSGSLFIAHNPRFDYGFIKNEICVWASVFEPTYYARCACHASCSRNTPSTTSTASSCATVWKQGAATVPWPMPT